jgi:hypothetical protein
MYVLAGDGAGFAGGQLPGHGVGTALGQSAPETDSHLLVVHICRDGGGRLGRAFKKGTWNSQGDIQIDVEKVWAPRGVAAQVYSQKAEPWGYM